MNEPFGTEQNICAQCGQVVDADAKFCKYCAFDLSNAGVNQDVPTEISQPRPKRNIIGIVGALCLLVFGLIGVAIKITGGKPNQSVTENVNSVSQETASTLTLGEKAQQIEEKILHGEALSADELEGFSTQELRILRNVHFARYGRKFDRPGLGDYFYNRPWYKPSDDYKDSLISTTDKDNINLIVATEAVLNNQTLAAVSPTAIPEPEVSQTPVTGEFSEKLSRSEAARLIPNDQKFSQVSKAKLDIGMSPNHACIDYSNRQPYFNLISLGYLVVKMICDDKYTKTDFSLTTKGKKESANWEYTSNYWGTYYDIPIAKREIVEVTGISQSNSKDNFAEITFTWHWKPLNEISKGYAINESNTNGNATLQRFDDGWRVVTVSGPGISGY